MNDKITKEQIAEKEARFDAEDNAAAMIEARELLQSRYDAGYCAGYKQRHLDELQVHKAEEEARRGLPLETSFSKKEDPKSQKFLGSDWEYWFAGSHPLVCGCEEGK